MALAGTLPFALPVFWDVIRMRWGAEAGSYLYLLKPVENQYWYLLLGASCIGVSWCALRVVSKPEISWRFSGIDVCVALLLAVQFVSALHSPNPAYSLRVLMMPVVFFAGYRLVRAMHWDEYSVAKLYLALVMGAGIAGLYAIAQNRGFEILPYSKTVEGSQDEITGKQLIASTFGHPNYMGSYIAPLLLWAFYFVLARPTGLLRLTGAICGLLIIGALVVGGTRGPWLALVATGIPYYLLPTLSARYRRPLLFTGGLAILLALVLLLVPNPLVHVHFDLQKRLVGSKEIAARFYYWLMALQMLRSHPVWGVGPGNFDVQFWDHVDTYQRQPGSDYFRYVLEEAIRGIRPGFVHNDHLQIITENGLAGAIVWLALWATLLTQAWTAARRFVRSHTQLLFGVTVLCSLLCFAIDGLTNFPLQVPVSGFLFWITLGVWSAFYDRTGASGVTLTSPAGENA
jgi:O-antigen ligase